METGMDSIKMQSHVYEYSRGFEDSVNEGNTNSGYHMEIQDAALDVLKYPGQGSETYSEVRGKSSSGTYQELTDYPQVGAYEVPEFVRDHPGVQKSRSDEYLSSTTKHRGTMFMKKTNRFTTTMLLRKPQM